MQPVHSYADKFFWLAFRPHLPSEYGWWFCNLFENVCSDVAMSHQVLRAGDITIWQPTEILFFRLPSDTCWNFNLTDTNAAYIYCRLKFLDLLFTCFCDICAIIAPVTRTCAMLNSLVNPLIYCWRQKEMRKVIFRLRTQVVDAGIQWRRAL